MKKKKVQWKKQNENYISKLANNLSSSRNTQNFTYDLIVGIYSTLFKHFEDDCCLKSF